jgi:hypothetical protein
MSTMLPTSWAPRPAGLLPSDPTRYGGPALAYWITTILLVLITARSLVHLFSPDGGAHSIATIDTSVVGGNNIIAIFGQWGASQLLLVGALWVLLLRYRGLVPFILCVLLLEPFLRAISGQLKPVLTLGTAPGAALNWVFVPVVAATLYLALCTAEEQMP